MAYPWTGGCNHQESFIIEISIDSLLKWFLCAKETSNLLGSNLFIYFVTQWVDKALVKRQFLIASTALYR